MKIKFSTKRKIASILAVCIAIALAAFVFAPTLTAYAAYSRESSNLTGKLLHSATLAASVSTDTPAITILTHGLGGGAKDWSNNFNGTNNSGMEFAKDSNSIIEKMRKASLFDINLYRAKIYASSFEIYSEYSNEKPDTIIKDFSPHTIIVMDIPNTKTNTMEDLYDRFHNVIDEISNDYLSDRKCLPRINLIGHSMGGLFNMQYAIEHPKNVAALVSLGTPYNGSWYDNWFVELLGINDFRKQPCISGTCGHEYYFCNLETRKNTWNSVYAQNNHIKFYTLSGETSLSMLDHLIYENNYLEDYAKFLAVAADLTRLGYVAIRPIGLFLPGDVCVDTASQKAVGYDGAINYNKQFTTSNCRINKRSQDDFPVPHNLEAYDKDMHNCILKVIDFGIITPYNSYTQNGMTASIIAQSDDKWLIQLTNNTGSARSFEYNQRMCFEGDAQTWNGLGDVGSTDTLANGASTIIEIQEFGTATSITMSYTSGSTRYIFYAKDLNDYFCTMTSYGSSKSHYSYSQNNMQVSIVSKYGSIWTFKLTNNTGSVRSFDYNQMMCFEGDAQNWNGLTNIATTISLANGASTIIEIQEHAAATSIAISYTSGSSRYIFYANNLNTSGTMTSYRSTRTYYSYSQHGMKVSIIGNNANKWLIELTNNTGISRSFDYNQKMCFEGDAKNWNGLKNIATVNLENGASTQIEILENAAATSIAISYTDGSTRYIFYANNLNVSGTMTSYKNTAPTYSYTQHGMKVGIVGKSGMIWTIQLTNNTGSACRLYYNAKMCYAGDAQNWTGLSDIRQTETLANGATTQMAISENASATSIAISYISGSMRYIFYAYDLNTAGTMTSFGSSKAYYSETRNGMKVSIAGKNDNTWLIELTNNTGSERTFEYNRRMCYAGDAQNWKGLEDVSSIVLANGAVTSIPLQITENFSATSIAISYMDGVYRKIFYAYDLNTSGTMSAFASTIDTSAPPPDECLAEGSLITLADGSQKAVEELTGDELLLVWNMETGTFDTAPIIFIDSDLIGHYEIIDLGFSDGTSVEVIYEHGFWDVDLNRYVYLDGNAAQYIGHRFNKQTVNADGSLGYTEVTLTDVDIRVEVTTAWSPVTYGHLCYYVNGMLSMPGGITGLFNIFEIDEETMTIDEEAYLADIAEYGLFTYEEFYETYPVSAEVFEAFNGRYLKVAIGKGMITYERLGELIERYSEFF